MTKYAFLAGAAATLISTRAWADPSSGQKAQMRGQAEIPVCSHRIGTLAIVEPDQQWWRELNLGSPEAIIKVFVQQSGCFTLVNRGGAMRSRAMERAMAEQGELQKGSNMGAGQVKAADYFLEPDIVTANRNSGGGGVGAAAGALGGLFGGWGHAVGAIAVRARCHRRSSARRRDAAGLRLRPALRDRSQPDRHPGGSPRPVRRPLDGGPAAASLAAACHRTPGALLPSTA